MCSSMAILRRYGWASSAAAISGKRSVEPAMSARWGRAACQSRATSPRSKALPNFSSGSRSRERSGTRDLLLQLLDAPEPRIEPARVEELRVAPRLHHAPLGEHDHAIGDLGGAQPVGHQEHRPPGDEPPETGGDLLLLRGVHRGEGVVEDEDRRRGHERPGERHALALPARQREPALAHHGRVARGEPLDLLRDAGRRRRRAHAWLVDLLPSEGDVVLEGTREEETLLGDVAEPGAEVRERQLRHVALADEDGARRRLPEPREQQAERGLAGPGRSDERDRLAGGDLETDGAQGGRPALEGEREVREPDRERAPVLSRRARGRRDG